MILRSLLAVAVLLAAAAPAVAAQPVALKSQLTASAQGVTLGDLFDGATGMAARVVVAPAPAAGLNAVLDAGQVQIAARTAGLDWDNESGLRRIIVASAGSTAAAPAARAATSQQRTQVLAYARHIATGEIVGPADLIWSDEAVAPAGAPGDPDAVIGMAARRPLRAGAAAELRDLSSPILIRRDEMVSVAFEVGGVSLVLQGKAMRDGALGDSLQVLNPQSKRVIEAVVSGPGRAVVGPAAQNLKARAFAAIPTASFR